MRDTHKVYSNAQMQEKLREHNNQEKQLIKLQDRTFILAKLDPTNIKPRRKRMKHATINSQVLNHNNGYYICNNLTIPLLGLSQC